MYRVCIWCGRGRTGWSGHEQKKPRGGWARLCFECWVAREKNPNPRVVMRKIAGRVPREHPAAS